jgi:hypothetical protein
MLWFAHKVRDIARGFSDANKDSMQRKLDHGKEKFTDREHSAFADKVQMDDDQVL